MRSWRRFWWWLKSFVIKQRRWLILAALAGGLILILLRNLLPLLPELKPKHRIGIVGQYTLNTLPQNVARNLGRGLFKLEKNGDVAPDLIQNWQVLDQDTRYVIKLLPDQFWNDSTPIRSTDLVFDLPDIFVDYPDSARLEFKLTQPYAPFLTLLTRPVFKNQSVGSGEYSIKSIERQANYLKRLRLAGPKNELDYRFYSSNQAAWLGFKLGEVDRLENLMINPLNKSWEKRVRVESRLNKQTYLAVLFNLADPNLTNKSLRQALAYATKNKSANPDSRALSPISPDSWAYNPNVKPYDYNPGQAKELFAKFNQEASGSSPLEITLGTSVSFLSLAEEIAASWQAALPVKINVKTVNSLEPDWQVILVAQEIPFDPDQHAFWHSTQPTNLTHYSDLKVDKLLEDGRQILDQGKRREIYQDFQRFIVEDSPAIFLSHPTVYTISRK